MAQYAILGAICVLVIGVYAWTAKSGCWETVGGEAVNSYYNLLVQGLRTGQLYLKREVPAGLTQLADPYDPKANVSYVGYEGRPLYDLSYYRGKLYLYFGITPALALLWPYYELTGCYLLHRHAVVIFCAVGFLTSMGLLWAMWHRHFGEVGFGVVGACTLVLGLASSTLLLLAPCDVYEVAVSCGYALVMLTLVAIGKALLELETRNRDFGKGNSAFRAPSSALVWLGAASLAYGLALGARPSLLFGALILLVPMLSGRQKEEGRRQSAGWGREKIEHSTIQRARPKAEGRRRNSSFFILPSSFPVWLAATGPITVLGLGLLFYNYLRFDNPFEFGQRFQLAGNRQAAAQQFNLSYLWINFRTAFLEPAQWSGRFPFVHDIAVPSLPKGYNIEHPFGVLSNIPLVWLALATPLAWCGRLVEGRSLLRPCVAALALCFGISALTLCLHNSMNIRYEVEFLPALVFLAVLGILSLERAFTERPLWRRTVRCGWGLLAAVSALFSLLATFGLYADTCVVLGRFFSKAEGAKAIIQFQKAMEWQPDNSQARCGMGTVLLRQGKAAEAIRHLEEALRLNPKDAMAHSYLGDALSQLGELQKSLGHCEEALRLKPEDADVRNNVGVVLSKLGRMPEAIGHLEEALRLQPEATLARENLTELLFQSGEALVAKGSLVAAITRFERVVQLKPDFVQAYDRLAEALCQAGRVPEAVAHLERSLQLMPDSAETRNNLGTILFLSGKAAEAVAQYERALRLKPDFPEAQRNLAWVLATCDDSAVRNGVRAVELVRQAEQLAGGKDPAILDTLAAAYAETGKFSDAIRTAHAALELAKGAGPSERAEQIQQRLQLYQTGQPYRDRPVPER